MTAGPELNDPAVAEACEGAVDDVMFDLGGDERRMHVRAYNQWVSLLRGRAYPSIEDLNPAAIADFSAHSVLLDFTQAVEDPHIAFIGRALREECGLEVTPRRVAEVPARSLLSRLTDHYLQIIANQAPIGFEAEFTNTRGHTTMYRGILMPFSSDGTTIDFIYGVINWKEVADPLVQATLDSALAAAMHAAPATPSVAATVWADGPSGAIEPIVPGDPAAEPVEPLTGPLGNQLTLARESAAAVRAADTRSRAALYRALGRAHDFGLSTEIDPEGYAGLLADAGLTVQARAPMTPIVKLVFGADYDKTRLAEFAAVLQHARRHAVPAGALPAFLTELAGGVKAIVAAEREMRGAKASGPAPRPVTERPVIGRAALDGGAVAMPGDTVILVARVGADGMLEIVGSVQDDEALADRVLRAAD